VKDDKGTWGKVIYKKDTIVEGKLVGDKVKINITPVKIYDMVQKKYVTINSIDVRSNFLEEILTAMTRPSVYTPLGALEEITTDGMVNSNTKKYKITKDYDALHIFTGNLIHTTVVRPPKRFYKGDIVDAKIYQEKIVSGNYDITEVAELYDDKKVEPQSEKEKSKLFTTNNILIGLAVIVVIGGYYIIKK
jgi:hypothetical protein